MQDVDRDKMLFDKWGIHHDKESGNWVTDRLIKCSFKDEPISRGFVVSVRDKVIGISGVYYMPFLMDKLFGDDPELESIEMLPFEYKLTVKPK